MDWKRRSEGGKDLFYFVCSASSICLYIINMERMDQLGVNCLLSSGDVDLRPQHCVLQSVPNPASHNATAR